MRSLHLDNFKIIKTILLRKHLIVFVIINILILFKLNVNTTYEFSSLKRIFLDNHKINNNNSNNNNNNNNINNDIWHTIYKIQKEKQNGYSEKKNNNIYTNIMNDKDGKIYLNTKSIINNYKEYIKNTYIYYNTFFKYVKYFITKIKNYNVIYEPYIILEQKSKTHISINNKKLVIQFLPPINKGTHILHNKTNDSIGNVLNDFHNKLVKRRVLLALMKRKKKDKRKSKLAKKKKLKDKKKKKKKKSKKDKQTKKKKKKNKNIRKNKKNNLRKIKKDNYEDDEYDDQVDAMYDEKNERKRKRNKRGGNNNMYHPKNDKLIMEGGSIT
ncbi:hypothetical protein PFDG_04378 [Plasmodium falciparum Dd2]|uniref:Uncharacterized protein n=1 Tax=Plasmodium falciparum (isolate Dd2) TaxID=57267 RepID=A0A0L7M4Y7_PLAF4|nr:hypothetical protein PFDG_04378 [Plasmodium falciparum Dd2]